jgi:hypothetical protein
MDLAKIRTVYDETLYIDREEYRRKIGQGRKLVKVYSSTGKVRTWHGLGKDKDPITMMLHVENIKEIQA